MAKPWSIYRPPIEHYEVGDEPEVRRDPVGKVMRIVVFFATIQLLNLLATLLLWLR